MPPARVELLSATMNTDHPSGSSSPSVVLRLTGSALPLLLGLFLSGCATTHEVKVDSLAKPQAEKAISYEIKNKNPLVADDSLRYQEAAAYVKTALSGKGMFEAPPGVKPDVIVDLDYGVGPPQMRRETISIETSPSSSSAAERTRTATGHSMSCPSKESVCWSIPQRLAARPNSASAPLWPPERRVGRGEVMASLSG